MIVYVSGPYSKGDSVLNVRAAVKAADTLFEAGFTPLCPHLTHLWHLISPKSWEDWMKLDLELLKACKAMLRIPGESKGADIEVAKAKECGIPVYYSIEELMSKESPNADA